MRFRRIGFVMASLALALVSVSVGAQQLPLPLPEPDPPPPNENNLFGISTFGDLKALGELPEYGAISPEHRSLLDNSRVMMWVEPEQQDLFDSWRKTPEYSNLWRNWRIGVGSSGIVYTTAEEPDKEFDFDFSAWFGSIGRKEDPGVQFPSKQVENFITSMCASPFLPKEVSLTLELFLGRSYRLRNFRI